MICLLLGSGISLLVFLTNTARYEPRVVFCNIGQGDGAYMRLPDGSDLLIDTGANRQILQCLQQQLPLFDTDLELVIITHHDRDHDGGLVYLREHYTIGQVLDSTGLHTGDFIEGKNSRIEILYDSELILLVSVKNTNVLFLSDVDASVSESILERITQPIDILKVSHHGSRYGTSTTLLQKLQPRVAVISVGKNNLYGHPHQETLDKLAQFGIPVRQTAKEGDIVFELK